MQAEPGGAAGLGSAVLDIEAARLGDLAKFRGRPIVVPLYLDFVRAGQSFGHFGPNAGLSHSRPAKLPPTLLWGRQTLPDLRHRRFGGGELYGPACWQLKFFAATKRCYFSQPFDRAATSPAEFLSPSGTETG